MLSEKSKKKIIKYNITTFLAKQIAQNVKRNCACPCVSYDGIIPSSHQLVGDAGCHDQADREGSGAKAGEKE